MEGLSHPLYVQVIKSWIKRQSETASFFCHYMPLLKRRIDISAGFLKASELIRGPKLTTLSNAAVFSGRETRRVAVAAAAAGADEHTEILSIIPLFSVLTQGLPLCS